MPSGESLLQRYIDRSGGAEAYAKAKNMAMSGTVEMPAQNITGTVAIFEEGEKSYTAMDIRRYRKDRRRLRRRNRMGEQRAAGPANPRGRREG